MLKYFFVSFCFFSQIGLAQSITNFLSIRRHISQLLHLRSQGIKKINFTGKFNAGDVGKTTIGLNPATFIFAIKIKN
ncbi:MAG: hypothetical protein JWQ14_3504 [Adhaeribacter sp.]|nr:hypothetical protein [Adhaeribacter sp.]